MGMKTYMQFEMHNAGRKRCFRTGATCLNQVETRYSQCTTPSSTAGNTGATLP